MGNIARSWLSSSKYYHDRVSSLLHLLSLIVAFFGLLGCGFLEVSEQPQIIATPPVSEPTISLQTQPIPSPTIQPSPVVVPDTGWENLRPGLERRIINQAVDGEGSERLYLLRIDPTLYRFDVAYRPGNPQSMTDWQIETGA